MLSQECRLVKSLYLVEMLHMTTDKCNWRCCFW